MTTTKSFSHREEAKSAKISKKKFKQLKNLWGFLSFFFVSTKNSSRSSLLTCTATNAVRRKCRGKREVFVVDAFITRLQIA
jgi:hypothetical protein